MSVTEAFNQLKGLEKYPDQEIFKIGPEVIEDFIGKLIVVMGGSPDEIKNIEVTHDKRRLRIFAMLEKESKVFTNCNEENKTINLSILGADYVNEEYNLTDYAKSVLDQFGYSYDDDYGRKVYLVNVTEYKKGVEIEFNAEVTMAIITDTDFTDKYFVVDAVEEVIQKKNYEDYKFKGKKKTITFAKVYRSFKGNNQGYDPEQVREWKSGRDSDEDDDDCD